MKTPGASTICRFESSPDCVFDERDANKKLAAGCLLRRSKEIERDKRYECFLGAGYCTPAACRYCRSANCFAAGNGGLIVPASPMKAITWVNPLRLSSPWRGKTLRSGSK